MASLATQTTELLELLQLEMIDTKLFRGQTLDIGSPIVYGGQVMAQALSAAAKTVPEDRQAHSFHCYFILPGDKTIPIIYEVDTIRDGGSFTTRRVVAIQKGRPIFNFSASFQLRQEGFEHQDQMPDVPSPESLKSFPELARLKSTVDFKPKGIYDPNSPIDVRPVEAYSPFSAESYPPVRHIWFRWKKKLDVELSLHRVLLAYISDYNLITTALLPHDLSNAKGKLQLASLDHAMWFHDDVRVDEWLLYVIDSPRASHARGFSRGQIFTKDGSLVASVTQEGLMRMRK